MMRRFFIETNAFNMVAFVDDAGNAFVIHEQAFDKGLTLENAKAENYSNLDGCETAEDCNYAMGQNGENVHSFENVCSGTDTMVEF